VYTDTILFLVGGVCAFLAIVFVVYLFVSLKRSRVYRSVLKQETEIFNALTTTASLTKGTSATGITAGNTTELLTGGHTTPPVNNGMTEIVREDEQTELLGVKVSEVADFDASALEGRYILRGEIQGGGMSRVFLADSAKLGNQWIVKFISNKNGELANEENILKLLNHISLPKIVDIFRDDKGVYLVESFIEGITLDKVLESGQKLNQAVVVDWAEQLAQVLNYLHKLEPHPIFHYDLKPSNIMVTHDNRLVLIDFGISKRHGDDETGIIGVTYQYAAPEQLKHRISDKHMSLIKSRFGELPKERQYWHPDARTDIYSFGVMLFELAVGQLPTIQNMKTLNDAVSNELCKIIQKCLSVDPSKRYQSANDVLMDLHKIKGSKIKMARTLFMRRLASFSCVFTTVVSGGSITGGYYIYGQENAALLDVEPSIVTISLQQSISLAVEKQMPSGEILLLDNAQIRWSYSQDNIARVDGNRISGMNVGDTELIGQHRNKTITLNVRVIEPMDGMVDISQRYQPGHSVKIYAGTVEREHIDGALAEAEFVSPESIAVADDGTVYIADSGLLRILRDGQVESADFGYLTPHIVRCFKNDVFILSDTWEI